VRKLDAMLIVGVLGLPVPAVAATALTPAVVQSTFGTGATFTAVDVGGKTYTMALKADGTATRTAKGSKTPETGTWRAAAPGYCSKWGAATTEQCYSIQQSPTTYDVYDSTNKLIAHWTK
jgi:hypothetical protein